MTVEDYKVIQFRYEDALQRAGLDMPWFEDDHPMGSEVLEALWLLAENALADEPNPNLFARRRVAEALLVLGHGFRAKVPA